MFTHLFGKPISMKGSILGFQELDTFVLTPVDQDNPETPFAYLQSLEQSEIGFLVTNPFAFIRDYEFKLSEQDVANLRSNDPEKIMVLNIVTIATPFADSTVNLLAPILIQNDELIGIQAVLTGDNHYTTRDQLFRRPSNEGGEPEC